MSDENTIYYLVVLACLALLSASVFLMPIAFRLRHRYYAGLLRGTAYLHLQRFRAGRLLAAAGTEIMSIGGAILVAWFLRWPPVSQDQWLRVSVVIFSLGMLCFLVGMALAQDGLSFLRARSRRASPKN